MITNFYETMYILRPDMGEENVDQCIQKYQDFLTENGAEIVETQHRGKRRLAYEIQNYREGIYIQMNFKGDGSQIAGMERMMRIGDDVIRYLTIKQDTAPTTASVDEADVAEAVEA